MAGDPPGVSKAERASNVQASTGDKKFHPGIFPFHLSRLQLSINGAIRGGRLNARDPWIGTWACIQGGAESPGPGRGIEEEPKRNRKGIEKESKRNRKECNKGRIRRQKMSGVHRVR